MAGSWAARGPGLGKKRPVPRWLRLAVAALVPRAATLLTLLQRGPTFLRRNFILPEHENFEPANNQQYNAEILVLSALRQTDMYFFSIHIPSSIVLMASYL